MICLFLCDHSHLRKKFIITNERCNCQCTALSTDSIARTNASIFTSSGFFYTLKDYLDTEEITESHYKEIEDLLTCCETIIKKDCKQYFKDICEIMKNYARYTFTINIILSSNLQKILMVCINYKDYEYAENALEALEEITEYCDSDQGAKIIECEVLKCLDTFFNRIIQNFSENGHSVPSCSKIIFRVPNFLCESILNAIKNTIKIDYLSSKELNICFITKALKCIKIILEYFSEEEEYSSPDFPFLCKTFQDLRIFETIQEFIENFDDKYMSHPNSEIRQISMDILALADRNMEDSQKIFKNEDTNFAY